MFGWQHEWNLNKWGPRRYATAVAVLVFALGLWWQHPMLVGTGAVLLCFVLRRAADLGSAAAPDLTTRPGHAHHGGAAVAVHARQEPTASAAEETSASPRRRSTSAAPKNVEELVQELIAAQRYALLLRPELKGQLTPEQIARAMRELDAAMSLVPGGRVLLGESAEQLHSAWRAADGSANARERAPVAVGPVYLDRYCVTNEAYQQFVDSGGYEDLEFWHEESLPALLDFVDKTAAPGPRFWSDGRYPDGAARLPVVGVSWYEACAYARWVGKRLPSDAEWTKAGAWPVEAAPGRLVQRRYPWGESYDVRRAQLYSGGTPGPVAVDEFPDGASIGGIHQLIGNVWEWTATPLTEVSEHGLYVSEAVISIRGGAFDTYFENQATCHYQSGEHRLARRPNIGFRLALSMAELECGVEPRADSALPWCGTPGGAEPERSASPGVISNL